MASQNALRSVQRIISLPITRPRPRTLLKLPPHGQDHSKILTYYHFQLHSKEKASSNPTGWIGWAQGKATETWAGFGKAPEGSWKLKVFRAGERIVDRIDFEELALKGVDPSLGPTVLHPDFSGKNNVNEKSKEEDTSSIHKIPLLYPPSIHSGEGSIEHLKSLLSERTPRHRKGFWMWMLVSPFTAPFMLIPVIPNLPFFFCVWRSWSHYRAYRASQYLTTLLDRRVIIAEASPSLDGIYKQFAQKLISESSDSTSSSSSTTPEQNSDSTRSTTVDEDSPPLLTREAVPEIITTFDLKKSAAADIYRALEQAKNRLNDTRR